MCLPSMHIRRYGIGWRRHLECAHNDTTQRMEASSSVNLLRFVIPFWKQAHALFHMTTYIQWSYIDISIRLKSITNATHNKQSLLSAVFGMQEHSQFRISTWLHWILNVRRHIRIALNAQTPLIKSSKYTSYMCIHRRYHMHVIYLAIYMYVHK